MRNQKSEWSSEVASARRGAFLGGDYTPNSFPGRRARGRVPEKGAPLTQPRSRMSATRAVLPLASPPLATAAAAAPEDRERPVRGPNCPECTHVRNEYAVAEPVWG